MEFFTLKSVRRLLLLLLVETAIITPISLLQADEHCERSPTDTVLIREFLNTKRTIPLEEKKCDLRISGDVRAQWQHRTERLNGMSLRSFHNRKYLKWPPRTGSTAVLNLRLDHKYEETWSHMHVAFDNALGTQTRNGKGDKTKHWLWGSGICDDIALKRAYWGANLWKSSKDSWCDGVIFAVEVGRRPLYTIFDSQIEFHARFDGILFKLLKKLSNNSELYLNGGPFVVDSNVNHFAYVAELGYLNVLNSRADIKYSFIDWDSWLRYNRCGYLHSRGWRFKVSQLAAAYNISDDILGRKARIFGAFLINGAARRIPETNYHSKNIGWYVGFTIGEVKKRGDWSFRTTYQYVQVQAIPEIDIHGVSLGNVRKETFTGESRGKANYRGFQVQFLYALTNKLSLDTSFDIAKSLDANLRRFSIPDAPPGIDKNQAATTSGRRFFSKFEISLIYAF